MASAVTNLQVFGKLDSIDKKLDKLDSIDSRLNSMDGTLKEINATLTGMARRGAPLKAVT